LLVAWVALLLVAFVQRQGRRRSPVASVRIDEPAPESGERAVRVHKGFVYSDTLGVEPNFRIASRETVEYDTGWYEMRDAEVSFFSAGRIAYGLVAERARVRAGEHEARVSGAAQLSLKGGLAVRAEGFRFQGGERILSSEGVVTFAAPGWGGMAGGLVASLAADTMDLVGGVSVALRGAAPGEPATVLIAPRVRYLRPRVLLEFPEGVTAFQGTMTASAPAAEMQLDREGGTLLRATFAAPMRLVGVAVAGGSAEALLGEARLDAIEGGRYRFVGEPAPELGWVRTFWRQAGAGWRELTAWRLVGEGTGTAWEWLEGQGLACLAEYAGGPSARRVQAERFRLSFEGGEARTAVAVGQVVAEGEGYAVDGHELTMSLLTSRFALRAEPGRRVRGRAPEGNLQADLLEGEANGALEARGNVTGTMTGTGLFEPGSVPVSFAARLARLGSGESRVELEGDARVWQGERLLRADRIEYDVAGEAARGEGSVVATLPAERGGRPASGALRVRGRAFDYSRPGGVAAFTGDVALEDPQATSRSQRLVATLGPGGEVLKAELEGGVEVLERATGRVLRGERALLLQEADTFEMWGRPVVAQEPSGNQIKADHLQWLRATGTVVVLGGVGAPSETLYRMDQPTSTPTATPRVPGTAAPGAADGEQP
jgi:lipopolysaccharide export system protein LptA